MATTKVTANVLADNSITQAKLADDAIGARGSDSIASRQYAPRDREGASTCVQGDPWQGGVGRESGIAPCCHKCVCVRESARAREGIECVLFIERQRQRQT